MLSVPRSSGVGTLGLTSILSSTVITRFGGKREVGSHWVITCFAHKFSPDSV